MRRAAFAALVLLALPAPADDRLTCGTVEALEITSLTRTRLSAFLRTVLPKAPAGSKIIFEGKIEVANTVMPLGPEVTAFAQHAEGRHEVVLLTDLELSKVPAELLARLRAEALDITFDGKLRSSSPSSAKTGPPVPVCAAGVLRVGTPDIRSSAPLGASLAAFSGARFTGISLTELEGQATATLFNPLSFPLDVKDLVYAVWAGDRKLAEGERHGVRLHAGRENAVELPISAPSVDLLSALGGAVASGGRVAGRLVARVSLRVGKDQVLTLPLDLPGSVQVMR
ncbi:MAG TPA: LEA type 2 family protein [Thermoanaerobaculia bacterium]|nr:LEA type 2 family protein [Thermoanaerobaculia bacterium]